MHLRLIRAQVARRLGWGFAALVCATSALADVAWRADAGIGRTDNVTRTSVDPQDETIANVGLQVSVDQRGSRVQSDIVANLGYYDYLDDTYDSEFLGNLVANASASIVPGTFDWVLSDNYGQVLSDPFTPATPDNRENVNYFSTGPELTFMFGTQTHLDLGARYVMSTYEDLPFDSKSIVGEGSISRDITRGSSLGVHARHQQLEYDDAPGTADFDQDQVFLRYKAEGARTLLRVDVGRDQVDRDQLGKQDGSLVRFEVTRRTTARSTLTFDAARQFESSGSAFAAEQSGGSIGLDASGSRQTFDPFLSERARLGWQLSTGRTDFGLDANWVRQTYEDQPTFDQTQSSIGGSVRRALTPTFSVRLSATQARSRFEEVGRDYDELFGGVSLEWRASRALTASLSYYRYDRQSDQVGGDYDENRIFLSIGYGRGAPRSRLLGPTLPIDSVQQETP